MRRALLTLLAYSSNYAAVITSLPLSAATGCACANMRVGACAYLLGDVNGYLGMRAHAIVVSDCTNVHADMCLHVVDVRMHVSVCNVHACLTFTTCGVKDETHVVAREGDATFYNCCMQFRHAAHVDCDCVSTYINAVVQTM